MMAPIKPTAEQFGISEVALDWQRSGHGPGAVEVAFVWKDGRQWALMRIGGDPAGRVLVFSRFEWDCFLDGARNGEFDDAALAQLQEDAPSELPAITGRRAASDAESGQHS